MALEFVETPCGLSIRSGVSTQELWFFRVEDGYKPEMRSAIESLANAIEPSLEALEARYNEGFEDGKDAGFEDGFYVASASLNKEDDEL